MHCVGGDGVYGTVEETQRRGSLHTISIKNTAGLWGCDLYFWVPGDIAQVMHATNIQLSMMVQGLSRGTLWKCREDAVVQRQHHPGLTAAWQHAQSHWCWHWHCLWILHQGPWASTTLRLATIHDCTVVPEQHEWSQSDIICGRIVTTRPAVMHFWGGLRMWTSFSGQYFEENVTQQSFLMFGVKVGMLTQRPVKCSCPQIYILVIRIGPKYLPPKNPKNPK
jgi:hypothetical protein